MRWAIGLVMVLAVAASGYAAAGVPVFNDIGSWRLEVRDPAAAATVRMESGALRFDITRKPGDPKLVQAYQAGKSIRDGATYTVRFAAKASSNRFISLNLQTDNNPWRQLIETWPSVTLTPQWQTYAVELHARDVRGATVRLPQFILGQAVGTVWIKDLAVTEGASAATPPAAPADNKAGAGAGAGVGAGAVGTTGTENGILGPLSDWKIEMHQGAEAAIAMVDGVAQATVTKTGPERWNVQLYQTPANLTAGQSYVLTIGIRADAPRKLSFMVQHDQDPYETLLPFTDLNVGPEWKQYKLKFPLSQVFPGHTRLAIQVGDAPGKVELRTATLTEAK